MRKQSHDQSPPLSGSPFWAEDANGARSRKTSRIKNVLTRALDKFSPHNPRQAQVPPSPLASFPPDLPDRLDSKSDFLKIYHCCYCTCCNACLRLNHHPESSRQGFPLLSERTIVPSSRESLCSVRPKKIPASFRNRVRCLVYFSSLRTRHQEASEPDWDQSASEIRHAASFPRPPSSPYSTEFQYIHDVYSYRSNSCHPTSNKNFDPIVACSPAPPLPPIPSLFLRRAQEHSLNLAQSIPRIPHRLHLHNPPIRHSTMGDQEEDYSSLPLTDRFTHKVC